MLHTSPHQGINPSHPSIRYSTTVQLHPSISLLIKFPFFRQFGGSSTRRRIKLKEVMDKDHGKKYLNGGRTVPKCNHCEYTSSWASDLRKHSKTHSGKNSNKCNQCEYTSSRAGNLRVHLMTHSGEKSNKCNQCDYASSQASHLRTHLKTHSGEKSNKCNQCDFTSSRADVSRTHLKCTVGKSQTNATSVTRKVI